MRSNAIWGALKPQVCGITGVGDVVVAVGSCLEKLG